MNFNKMKQRLFGMLEFSSFKAGVIITLICTVSYHQIMIVRPDGNAARLVTALDDYMRDAMLRIRGEESTAESVVIVDIDDRSLNEIGQWPWSRDKIARMLRNISDAGARVIGIDAVFAEPDRTSPSNYVDFFSGLGDEAIESAKIRNNDLIMGEAVGETPTILGYVFITEKDDLPDDAAPFPAWSVQLMGDSELVQTLKQSRIPLAFRTVLNIPEIAGACLSEGFFNTSLDETGMVRRVPLLWRYRDTVFPALSLEMLREGQAEGTPPTFVRDKHGIRGIKVGETTLPTDEAGRLFVNFRGPAGTFPYLSASDLLQEKFLKEMFKGKYVLIGASAAGLKDLRTTPFEKSFPGVEVHANMIDNMLKGDPMRYDIATDAGVAVTIILGGGVVLSALLAYFTPLVGAIAGLTILLGTGLGNYWFFFLDNQLVGVVFPSASLLLVYMFVTVVNYFLEGRQKRLIRGMFSTMVSGDVLKYMEDNPGSFSLAGEQRHATMFFSDVAGFTTISESLPPADLVLLLNAYLTPMTDIIMEHEGYVDKYEGDAIMAEWGVPFPLEDHARLACYAALEQQKKLSDIREQLNQRFGQELYVRMGLNSGFVSAGNMGSINRFSYTVMGDAVNQAARFEPANKDYNTDIMMGATTYELAKDHIDARLLDRIVVKGKTEPITIYELMGRKGEISADRDKVARLYEEALKIHWERKFDEATAKLEESIRIDPEDGPSNALLKRIRGYRATPPPDSWQGEYIRAGKD